MVYAQQPMYHAYAAALDGLTRQQRALAVTAVRRDTIPADPAVLAGAIRVGALSRAYLDLVTKSTKAARWWMPAIYIPIIQAHEVDYRNTISTMVTELGDAVRACRGS